MSSGATIVSKEPVVSPVCGPQTDAVSSPPGVQPRARHPAALVLARSLAVLAAIVWAFGYYGLIDLSVVIIQDERFYDFYLVDAGWGLLYAVLVGFPLVAFAVRPRARVCLQQLIVISAAILICALITPASGQLAPAVLLAVTGTVLSGLSGHGLVPVRGLSLRGINKGMAVLAVVAAVSSVAYAATMIQAARAGHLDDDTWGLMHLPMQAAFALSVAGVAVLAVLADAAKSAWWQVSAWSAAVSALWLGLLSVAYPEHLGSVGRIGGVAAIVWGAALAVGTVINHRTLRHPIVPSVS